METLPGTSHGESESFPPTHWSVVLMGEPDLAITLIERLLSIPGPVDLPDFPSNITLADLRLRWEWDPLRSNPRFQKIVAGPEPQTVLTPIQQVSPTAPGKSISVDGPELSDH